MFLLKPPPHTAYFRLVLQYTAVLVWSLGLAQSVHLFHLDLAFEGSHDITPCQVTVHHGYLDTQKLALNLSDGSSSWMWNTLPGFTDISFGLRGM